MNARYRMPRALGALLAAGLMLPAAARAQAGTPSTPDTLPEARLERIVVTATRSAVSRDAVPQKVDVVTRTDLERSAAADVSDALKKHAAVDVIQMPGLLSGVGVRGFRPQYSGINSRTLVLVDGRPAGATNLALLGVQDVERVEVLKGPGSALYGSSAMGGVVNLITRRSAGALRTTASLGYGSWETREASLASGGGLGGGFDFDLGARYFERGGDYRVGKGNVFRGWIGSDVATKTLPDGSTQKAPEVGDGAVRDFSRYDNYSANLRLGYRLSDAWRVDVRGERFAADRVQNPGDLLAAYDSRSLKDVARNSLEAAASGSYQRHDVRLKLFTAAEDADYYSAATGDRFVNYRTPTRWTGAQAQDAIRFGTHTLTAGVDYTSARAESESFSAAGTLRAPYSPNSEITSTAAFAEGRFGFLDERLIATLGGRLDRIGFQVKDTPLLVGYTPNSESFTSFNPSAGLQYRTEGGVRAHASAGRAFVTPEAFSVAGRSEQRTGARSVALTLGNPSLKPENSFTWDAGLGLLRSEMGLEADVTYFRTHVRDRITTRRTVPGTVELTSAGDTVKSITRYVNADRGEIEGVEWQLGYDLGAHTGKPYSLRLFTNATHILKAEEITGGVVADIRNVASLTLNYGVEYDDRSRFSTRLSGRYVGERSDADYSDWMNPADVRYPRFMTMDAMGELRVTSRYRVGLFVENLTDENYYEVRGYSLPGRTLKLQVRAEW